MNWLEKSTPKILAIIENEEFKSILESEDFYFKKGQDKLNEWLNLAVSESLLDELSTLAKDYKNFKAVCEEREDLSSVATLLYSITSYCDSKALNKDLLNQYPDKRVIARANVRMNAWITYLINYKKKEYTSESVQNACNYLLDPHSEINILSENHRKQVSNNILKKEYNKDTFVLEIIQFFEQLKIDIKNEVNRTHFIVRILYSFKSDWQDEIIGLMAADNTGWQDNFIHDSNSMDGIVLWNHRTPTGRQTTIKALRSLINDDKSFNLYYKAKNQIRYKAEIIDFAINQDELDKWNVANGDNIYNFHSKFNQYNDGKRTASIIFLAKDFQKIEPIEINQFSFYNSKAPTQVNVSPIKAEPENIKTINLNDSIIIKNNSAIMSTFPLNQILYGPPGTGKTFHTINKALEIQGYNFNGKSRVDIKADFEKYINSGQIVFTTFHQSLGYEEFIEGLKPLEPKNDGDSVTYKVIDGIFKLMCTNSLPFSIGEDINGYIVESVTRELLTLKKKRTGTLLPISMRMLRGLNKYLQENELSIDRVKEKINFTDEVKSAYPEIEPYLINGYNTIIPNLLKILNNTTSSNIPKVLIIDEINRGNVSQIFGELITLIEKDKRKGNSEELTVTLPYSKKEFGVPNNLYIIGTMNTADRSVEALDSALRRRFVFEEMKPQPEKIAEIRKQKNIDEKIDNIDLGGLLTTINNRIEKLLDRDHTIGHSYFLDCKNIEELKDTFYKNIIPLLQEYFYGDYAKIGLILGVGFIKSKEAKDILFADFNHDNRDLYDEKRLYEIVDYRGSISQKVSLYGKEQELSFEQAIDLLLNRKISE